MPSPPKRADAFLAWFCPSELIEDIQGDLYELYTARLAADAPWKARLW